MPALAIAAGDRQTAVIDAVFEVAATFAAVPGPVSDDVTGMALLTALARHGGSTTDVEDLVNEGAIPSWCRNVWPMVQSLPPTDLQAPIDIGLLRVETAAVALDAPRRDRSGRAGYADAPTAVLDSIPLPGGPLDAPPAADPDPAPEPADEAAPKTLDLLIVPQSDDPEATQTFDRRRLGPQSIT